MNNQDLLSSCKTLSHTNYPAIPLGAVLHGQREALGGVADSVPPIRLIPFDEVNAAPAVARQENVDSAPAPERLPAPPQDLRWLRVEEFLKAREA